MKHTEALWAGIVAGSVTSLCMALARLVGIPVHVELALGSLLVGELGPAIGFFGLLLFLASCGLVAQFYGAGFELLTRRSGWKVGLMFCMAHMVFSGVVLGAITAVHPLMPSALPPLGAFMTDLSAPELALFLGIHAVFGVMVGTLYVSRTEENGDLEKDELESWVR